MAIKISEMVNEVITLEPEWGPDERRKAMVNWRTITGREKLNFLHKELHSVVVTLLSRKTLNEGKLAKVLSLQLTLDEAMTLKITNIFAYIIHLIRKNTSSTARKYLNLLSNEIERYEDLLHKKIEKEVVVFRRLEDAGEESGSSDGESVVR